MSLYHSDEMRRHKFGARNENSYNQDHAVGTRRRRYNDEMEANDLPIVNSLPEIVKRTKKEELEAERASRMARLRAENELEENKLVKIEKQRAQDNQRSTLKLRPKETILQINEHELEGLDESAKMEMLLGFGGGFGSTKGQKVEDNFTSSARGAAAKNKARKYRQYMNRKNGFNRPLDKMA